MSELVESHLESMTDELAELKRIKLFSPEEVKLIVKTRKEHEYRINGVTKHKEDYIAYIMYEKAVLKDIRIRRNKLGIADKKGAIEYKIIKRIHKLYENAIQRYSDDFPLSLSYFKFCKDANFQQTASLIIQNMTKKFIHIPEAWLVAASWYLKSDLNQALNMIYKGITHHKDNQDLYCEAVKLELYNRYVNKHSLGKEVDDIVMHDAAQEINKDLETIYKFSTEHNLKLNPDKSTVILFARDNILDQLKSELKLEINGTTLNYGSVSKNLGLLIDENMRFKEHVSVLVKRAYTRLRLLYNSKHILNISLKKRLCECLVLSIFQYAFIVYFPCLDQATAYRIQRIQNNCCRYIFNIRKYDHISAKIVELNWLKMNQRFKYNLLTFVHKILCTAIPSYLREKLIYREKVHDVNIRYNQILTMPLHSTALFNRCFTYNSILLYNSLPLKYKNLSVTSFHKQIYSYCLSLQTDLMNY